jgi:predicted ATPase/DNA-binding XRE family transcriptional regulator
MEQEHSFGQQVKQRRKALDLTQEALASGVGCSIETIRKVERDVLRPSRQIAERLAEQLAVAPADRPAFVSLARAIAPPAEAPATSDGPSALPLARRPLTPLVGRDALLGELRALIAGGTRLLTLTGPPGVGKTRLSLQLAAELGPSLADGACFVPLVSLADPGGVADAVLGALGAARSGRRPAGDELAEALRKRELLLVLDNFEHLIAAAPLVAALLQAAPRLRVLATSRVPLRLAGEREHAVPPLPLPWAPAAEAPPQALDDARIAGLVPTFAEIAESPAVTLFVQRAQAARADFALSEANALTVATICARLDGLPLAIELAAPRIKLFTPQALLHRLDHRLALLADGARDLPLHQRTLRAAIDWSYHLLDARQQELLAALSVFAGGCSLEAAEAVCAAEPEASPWPLLDALGSLIDHSLVQQEEGADGEPRFSLLEAIREYGDERLAASGAREATRERHARFFLARVEAGDPLRGGADQALRHDWLEREHNNLRSALASCLRGEASAELGLRLGWGLHRFWEARGHVGEGRAWLDALLALPESRDAGEAYGLALDAAGFLAWVGGDAAGAERRFALSAEAGRSQGHSAGSAHAVYALGYAAAQAGAHARASRLLHEALEVAQALGSQPVVGSALTQLAASAAAQGDASRAQHCYGRALDVWRALGNRQGGAMVLGQLGAAAWREGDAGRAEALYADALATWTELGNGWGVAHTLHALAWLALLWGAPDRVAVYLAEALERFATYEHRQGILACIRLAALLAVEAGALREGARIAAAAQALGPAAGLDVDDPARCERAAATARARLEPAEHAAAWGEGAALGLGEATALALAALRALAVGTAGTAGTAAG